MAENSTPGIWRQVVPALLAGVVFAIFHYVSSEIFVSPTIYYVGSAEYGWRNSNPAIEFWHNTLWLAVGIAVSLVLGLMSKSIVVALLRGSLFGIIAMLSSDLFRNLENLSEPGSMGWLLLALPILFMMSLAPAAVCTLVSAIGYGGKRLLKKRTESSNLAKPNDLVH